MTDLQTIGLLGASAGLAELLRASGRDVVTPADEAHLAELAGVDAVLAAGPEDAGALAALLARVAAAVAPTTPILLGTATLSVTDLAAALPHPERVAGLHVLAVLPASKTVEVVPALQTHPDLVERLVRLVESLPDRVAVVVKDRPGFLVDALLLPYLNDVIQELDDELATAEDIDVALQLGLGYRTGPLELLDGIGLDVHLAATESIHAATGDARYAPPPLLRQMVAAGRLGTRSGRGFRAGTAQEGS